jgi:polyisoprenoid-binding protein YceI
MKSVTWAWLFVVVVLLVYFFGFSRPPEDVARADVKGDVIGNDVLKVEGDAGAIIIPIDISTSFFEFEGFGPGKSHIGTFKDWRGALFIEDGEIVGLKGVIKADSVSTGIEKLDKHLPSDDFFDAALYPEIEFVSSSIIDGEMAGVLDFRGVKKEISFPVEISENRVSAEFILDVTPFEFKYVGIDKEVRIAFEFVG